MTDQRNLILTAAQLEIVRAALVERIHAARRAATESPNPSTREYWARRERDIDAVLLLVAKA